MVVLCWIGCSAIQLHAQIVEEHCLFAPGDYGSRNWRIPAIRQLSDGSLLVVNDKRKFNQGDLPEDIDVVARRSTDGGRSWSEPVTLAQGTGVQQGYGDPAIVETQNGEVICAFVGGAGFWESTLESPQRTFICRSQDYGQSWSFPEEITSIIWGPDADNPVCRAYESAFIASGNGLLLTRGPYAGRVLFVAAVCRNHNVADNFVVYSDDNGYSWHVSELAFEHGDEAKLVELVNGDLLMSVRQSGERGFVYSSDGGVTWQRQGYWPEIKTNACNGDLIRYAVGNQQNPRNILVHSIPNSMQRENVSLFFSYDEGLTWVDPQTICSGGSAYSSLTLLSDGLIGIYYEKETDSGYELWFARYKPILR